MFYGKAIINRRITNHHGEATNEILKELKMFNNNFPKRFPDDGKVNEKVFCLVLCCEMDFARVLAAAVCSELLLSENIYC